MLFLCQRSVLARRFFLAPIGASSAHLLHRNVFCASAASQRLLCTCCIAASSAHLLHRSVFCASVALQRLLRSGKLFRSDFHFAPSLPRRFGQQHLPDGSPPQRPGQQHLPDGSPQQRPQASNKPHLAEKSTPVWLAIWRNWAGFANSQHRDAAFATPNNIYVRIHLCCHIGLLLRHSQISRPICTDCLRHLRISAK